MANSNGWGDGAANNAIGWGQGANNAIAWGDSHAKSWAGATDIVGLTTDPAASAFIAATGITGATQQAAIDNLVKGLKTDGIWSKMKAVYPFVTDNRNLLGYTEDFSNAYWSKDSATIKTPNYAAAPDGTMTACRVYNGGYLQTGAISVTLSQQYTVSFYMKTTSGNTSTVRLFIDGGANTSTKTITGTWTRVSATLTANVSNSTFGFFLDSSDVLIWHPQGELGSTATDYQPIATTQQAYIATQFKYNLVNPVDSDAAFRLVFNGGWTHSSNGATPNGTNGYADTKLVPSSVFSNNNNGNFGYYHRTILKNLSASIGAETPYFIEYVSLIGTSVFPSINDSNSVAITITKNAGFRQASRDASNVNNINYRYNDTNYVKTEASTGRTTNAIRIGSSTGLYYSDTQFAFVYFGDTQLTQSEQSNYYTRVQAYQTALSRQV
jgi:hypothetical protein